MRIDQAKEFLLKHKAKCPLCGLDNLDAQVSLDVSGIPIEFYLDRADLVLSASGPNNTPLHLWIAALKSDDWTVNCHATFCLMQVTAKPDYKSVAEYAMETSGFDPKTGRHKD